MKTKSAREYYEILGLQPGASKEEIKRKYKELAKMYHPDRHANNPLSGLAEEKFKEINEAYEYLINHHSGGSSRTSSNHSGGGGTTRGYNTDQFNNLMNEVARSMENRMWSKVVSLCDQALQYNRTEPMVYVFKACALREMNQHQAAINNFKTAESYNWNPHPYDLWTYALCNMELGRFYEAIPLAERVIQMEGEVPNVIAHLAWCYESVGNKSQADYYWNRLEVLDPNNEMLRQRKQSLRIGDQYVSKGDAAVGACGICACLELIFDCC